MLEQRQKQTGLSTLQSRRNTEFLTYNSYTLLKEIRYNINDYLPNDNDQTFRIGNYQTNHLFSFGRKDGNSNSIATERQHLSNNVQDSNVQPVQYGLSSALSSMQQLLAQKQSQIQSLNDQLSSLKLSTDPLHSKIVQLTTNITELTAKISAINEINQRYREQLKTSQQRIKRELDSRSLLQQQISDLRVSISKKRSNIRIFNQKYEVNIQPKIKHKYTIQVQTDRQLVKPTPIIEQLVLQQLRPKEIVHNIDAGYSNRKISVSSVGNPNPKTIATKNPREASYSPFYQLYQRETQQQQNFQLQNQMTSRSQVIGQSYSKPRRPNIVDNISDVTDRNKQNDRNKGNKIDLLPVYSSNLLREKDKVKVKSEQIQICPIQEDCVQGIVQAILNMQSFK